MTSKQVDMTVEVDMDRVRKEVARQLPLIQQKSTDELKAELGQVELSEALFDPGQLLELKDFVAAGDRLMNKDTIHGVLCLAKNKKLVEDWAGSGDVLVLVGGLLSLFGISFIVPTVIITVADL